MQDVTNTPPLHVLMFGCYWTSASSRRGFTRRSDVDIHSLINWLNRINLVSILALAHTRLANRSLRKTLNNFAGESLCVLKKSCISCMKRDYC